MKTYFTSTVAATALMALLAGPALAQEAVPARSPETAAAEANAPVALPQVLSDLGLTDVTSKKMRRGDRISGKLPDGTPLVAMLDGKGELRGVRAGKDGVLPSVVVDRLVPQVVRNQPIYGEIGKIGAIFMDERGVMLAGQDGQANAVRAGFAQDGTLMRFDRGDGMGRDGKEGRRDRRHGDKDGEGRHHEDRDHKGGPKDHDDMMEDMGGMGHGADGPKGPRDADVAPLSPDQIRGKLTEAGYTEIGQILQQGPITIAQATNPEGEQVLVELGPRGRVVRELNR